MPGRLPVPSGGVLSRGRSGPHGFYKSIVSVSKAMGGGWVTEADRLGREGRP